MANLRASVLQLVIRKGAQFPQATQKRWAQVHDVRFLATQPVNQIFEKYREKLGRKAKEEGLRDINELRVAYKDKIEDFETAASLVTSVPKAPRPSVEANVPTCAAPSVPQIPAEFTKQPTIKSLSSFLDISKTRNLPPKEIEAIWRLRHASSTQSLCATIPVNIYNEMEATARKHPFFILPLPKEGQGAEIHFLQWIFPAPNTVTVLFTQLAEYKLRGEFSQPHTTITHHLDLAEPAGLVLMQGQVLKGRGITIEEAKWLVMCLQKFYGTGGGKSKRRDLLELFGRGEEGFKLEELIDEAEKLL